MCVRACAKMELDLTKPARNTTIFLRLDFQEINLYFFINIPLDLIEQKK